MSTAVNQEGFMRRCFELAQRGIGRVSPNPMVGCVIVGDGKIIAEGYHRFFGGPHAEVEALNVLSMNGISNLKELELYVNLEPCNHFGKTPPCTDAIVRSGIRKVIVSNVDPNPMVAGQGIRKLKTSGITVQTGLLSDDGAFLNRRFMTLHTLKRPYVILKWAQSRDGYIAPNEVARSVAKKPFWISGEASRQLVHKWRSEEQGILVGRKTIEDDDPQLTCRHPNGTDPVRIIVDPSLSLNLNHQAFSKSGRVLILNHLQQFKKDHLEYIKFKSNQVQSMLDAIHTCGILSVMVEGGKKTLDAFLQADLWDEARVFTGNIDLKEGLHAPTLSMKPHFSQHIAEDHLEIFYRRTSYHHGN